MWTGNEMIVWGGFDDGAVLNTGGRYNPTTNIWAATSSTNAPSARGNHTAVWTGSNMISCGGAGTHYLDTAATFNRNTTNRTTTSNTGARSGRISHQAV